MNNRKREKGIALIVLAVTIIVILILAGATIATLIGENGIISQTHSSEEAAKKAELKEKIEAEAAEKRFEDLRGQLKISALKEVLDQYFENVPEETQITSETELVVKKEYGKYKMKISEIDVGEITSRFFCKYFIISLFVSLCNSEFFRW